MNFRRLPVQVVGRAQAQRLKLCQGLIASLTPSSDSQLEPAFAAGPGHHTYTWAGAAKGTSNGAVSKLRSRSMRICVAGPRDFSLLA